MDEGNGSQLPGGFMPAWRRAAETRGIVISLESIYDFQGNPSGGRTQKGTAFGRLNGVLQLDLEKLAHWKGGKVYVSGLFQRGSELSKTYVGAWDLASSVSGTPTFRINEFYLQPSALAKNTQQCPVRVARS